MPRFEASVERLGETVGDNRSPILTRIRRCELGPFASKTAPTPAFGNGLSTVLPQDFRVIFKGLAMLIRSETNGLIDGAASARTIAAASLPVRLPTAQIQDRCPLLGLLLLTCP